MKELTTNAISCRICGERVHLIDRHLKEKHEDCSLWMYQASYSDAPIMSTTCSEEWKVRQKRSSSIVRTPVTKLSAPTIDFAGIPCKINLNVPANDCLPLPPHYRIPTDPKSALRQDIEDAMESITGGDSVFIFGPPGTGKDALFHAFSAKCRMPAKLFQVRPQADIEQWLFSMGFNKDGVIWDIGALLEAVRDGYDSPIDGEKIPYKILISDFDRSVPEQAEIMRMITDSISGRVEGPKGNFYSVLPGTQFFFTGNSCGLGDDRGLCISSNIMDSSLLDRIHAKYKFHQMTWADEVHVIRSKFPDVARRIGNLTLAKVGEAVEKLRAAIDVNYVHMEFSHRTVCGWFLKMRHKITRRFPTNKLPKTFLKDCTRVFLDPLDPVNRERAETSINPFLDGGCLDEGDTSHIHDEDLADRL